jgi:hypothetical protein
MGLLNVLPSRDEHKNRSTMTHPNADATAKRLIQYGALEIPPNTSEIAKPPCFVALPIASEPRARKIQDDYDDEPRQIDQR